MIFLGQSIVFGDEHAIFLGEVLNDMGGKTFYFLKEDGEVVEKDDDDDWDKDITRFIYMKDKASPTGKRIYYGGLCRFARFNGVKMKSPDKAALENEFKTIKKISIDND